MQTRKDKTRDYRRAEKLHRQQDVRKYEGSYWEALNEYKQRRALPLSEQTRTKEVNMTKENSVIPTTTPTSKGSINISRDDATAETEISFHGNSQIIEQCIAIAVIELAGLIKKSPFEILAQVAMNIDGFAEVEEPKAE